MIEVTRQAETPRRHPSRIGVEEIMQDLGLGRERVYGMLKSKIIPNVKLGRTFLVTRFAYENWKRTCGASTNGEASTGASTSSTSRNKVA